MLIKRWTAIILLAASAPLIAQNASLDLARHLKYLSSDELRGRGNYGPEIDDAADYIAEQFRSLGLEPAGENGSYFQPFALPTLVRQSTSSYLAVQQRGRRIVAAPDRDYALISASSSMILRGGLVFAGFGVTAPELGIDDYSSIDVRGKVVLVLEGESRNTARLLGAGASVYSATSYKIANALNRGAVAVIVLSEHFDYSQEAVSQRRGGRLRDLGIPAIEVGPLWAEQLPVRAKNLLRVSLRRIARGARPTSIPLSISVEMRLEIIETRGLANNVVGLLPGASEETIIVGAHYDHVGLGENGVRSAYAGEIHNGADDNASGTAALLMLAQELAAGPPLNRSVLFMGFAGEELGLLGSRRFVRSDLFDPSQTVAMLNMDMIGRSQGDLFIVGVGTAREFGQILEFEQRRSPLNFRYSQTPQAPSDHMPFSHAGVPVLFFTTGLHKRYHRPDDDWETIDLGRTLQVMRSVSSTIRAVDRLSPAPEFVDLNGNPESVGPAVGGQLRPVLGVRPDTVWRFEGVRFDAIQPNSPATEAGLLEGDVLIGFDGSRVDGLYDFSFLLGDKLPGETVEIMVLRDGQLLRKVARLAAADFE